MKLSAMFGAGVMVAVLGVATTRTSAESFANNTPIIVPASGSGANTGAPANPYPSTITVSGVAGVVGQVIVNLSDFRHHFPDDVDVMLVSPTGQKMIIMSDAGGNVAVGCVDSACTNSVGGPTVALLDSAADPLPDATTLNSGQGVWRPANYVTGDAFPAPAPANPASPAPVGSATFASTFNGIDPNGTWSLYVVDDTGNDVGKIANGWSLFIQPYTPVAPGDLVISEFRLRGPSGPNDEFIEIYNTTTHDIQVGTLDGSAGLAVVASDGVVRGTVLTGTVIPAHGHFLITNISSGGYSLSNYPGGDSSSAGNNDGYTPNIPDNAGIALFSSAVTFNMATRLDAVGSTSEANPLYKEGTGYTPVDTSLTQGTLFRKFDLVTGLLTDTNNNASDFFYASTDSNPHGPIPHLGAPAPENLKGPIFLGNTLGVSLVDPGCAGLGGVISACAEAREPASDPANHATLGTLSIRRKITNNSSSPITRLRFRVIDILGVSVSPGKAGLRVLTSSSFTASLSGGGTTTIQGLTLEEPPTQTGQGGGLNSSLSAGTVVINNPLAPGASLNVHFLLGVQTNGAFDFEVVAETLPAGGTIFSFSDLTTATLANISTRLQVETGDNVLIGGFIVTGTQDKKVIVRGIGPSLPLAGRLDNPTLQLYHGDTLLDSNDNWIDSANKQAIIDSGIPPTNDLESAIIATLPANNAQYTAQVRGAGGTTGIGIVEAYDLDRTVDSKLGNISTRGLVQGGDNVLIAGTIALGVGSQKVIVRAIGPSLGFPGTLADPTLELRDQDGALLESNDNWKDSPNKQAIIDSTIPPTNDLESAIVRTLPGGGAQYTAIVRSSNGATGVALVEIYALD